MLSRLNIYRHEKQYDLIYENYGKLVYSLFTPKEYKEKDIDKLMDMRQYSLIKDKYYSYPKEVSKLYDKEFNKLYKEKQFFKLQEKYPGLILSSVIRKDYKYETGKRLTLSKAYKYKILTKKQVIGFTYFSSLLALITSLTIADIKTSNHPLLFIPIKACYNFNSSIIFYKEVEEYDNELAKYADNFDLETMSDLEIIVKVMNDIRSNTYYGNRVDEPYKGTYFRLELNDTNDIGVCRHMADKFTTIMNLINPDYKAINMIVNLNKTYLINTCNIYGKEESVNSIETTIKQEDYHETEIGNHLVTLLKPREGNYYLVVDVTNPSIGVLENGKIHMFNNDSTESLKYVPYGQIYIYEDNSVNVINRKMLLSNFVNLNFAELKDKYGLDKQNETIEKIKTLDF